MKKLKKLYVVLATISARRDMDDRQMFSMWCDLMISLVALPRLLQIGCTPLEGDFDWAARDIYIKRMLSKLGEKKRKSLVNYITELKDTFLDKASTYGIATERAESLLPIMELFMLNLTSDVDIPSDPSDPCSEIKKLCEAEFFNLSLKPQNYDKAVAIMKVYESCFEGIFNREKALSIVKYLQKYPEYFPVSFKQKIIHFLKKLFTSSEHDFPQAVKKALKKSFPSMDVDSSDKDDREKITPHP
ncbi:MAG: hypothetical protein KBD64_01010 [Gammaproteobacteria bacterium]|nr:hypothetical protein [Gammaproteobacteria bacterium]